MPRVEKKKRKSREKKKSLFKKLKKALDAFSSTESDTSSSSFSSTEPDSGGESIEETRDDILPQEEVPNELASLFPTQQNAKPEGKEIHQQIADNWTLLLTKGLDKEERTSLLAAYPGVKNCPRLAAPVLNEEIQECLLAPNKRQDSFLCNIQEQLGCGLAALAQTLDTLYKNPVDATNPLLPALVDSARLLADLHHTTSLHRRFLLGPHLNSEYKKVLDGAPIDSKLYGENFPEAVKGSQQAKKASVELALGKASTSKTPAAPKKQFLNYTRPKAKVRHRSYGTAYRRDRSRSPQPRRSRHYTKKWKQQKNQQPRK